MKLPELSADEARRVALDAALPQHLPDTRAVLDHLHAIQLDAISVLAKAHQLTLTARLPHATIHSVDADLWAGPQPIAFEYPAHAQALVPLADWPLWAIRRRATRKRPQYPDSPTRNAILRRITTDGPLTLRTLQHDDHEQPSNGWDWNPIKTAVTFMLWAGDLASVRRQGAQRLFDLPERCIPHQHLNDKFTDDDCLTGLLTYAGRALGVTTSRDLADYFRIPHARITRLIPDTPLTRVTVEGWTQDAWAHPTALHAPAQPPTAPLFLGPFDNLLWYRPRVQRFFHFTHTLEAYKPAAQRTHGYYVCPLLADNQLVARADLHRTPADNNTAHVLAAATEPGIPPDTDLAPALERLNQALGHHSDATPSC